MDKNLGKQAKNFVFDPYASTYLNGIALYKAGVKEAAKILVGWNGEKDEKSRKLLVDLKQLSIEYNNAPTKYIKEEYDNFTKSNSEYLFIHIREIEEIEKVKNLLNAKTLLIRNPRVALITSNNSDGNVYKYNYDYIIENDGTLEDLKEKAKKFVTA